MDVNTHHPTNITQVVGFCPTGWHAGLNKKMFPVHTKGACSVVEVPYRCVCVCVAPGATRCCCFC